jgi:hypothetical protein
MYNRFLGQSYAGKSESSDRILATVMTWGSYLLLGGIPMLLLMVIAMAKEPDFLENYQNNPFDLAGMNLPPFGLFITLMLSFVIGMAGLLFGVIQLQKRHFKTLITGFSKIRWGRMAASLGLWMGLSGLSSLASYLLYPGSITFNPDAGKLLWFALPALLLIPIQSAFEEMAIRGQMLQNMSRRFTSPLTPLIITSVFFALLHGMNNEIAAFGLMPMMTYYFSFGFLLGMITLMDEGLELAIGIHVGNNLFAFLFVTYPGAALETPSIFIATGYSGGSDLGIFYACAVIVLMVFFGKKTRNYRALLHNEPINPYENSVSEQDK